MHNLYTTGLHDADNEIKSIKKSLDCIRDIRTLQSEIHLIKTNIETLSGHHGKDKPKASMRRGVLMSILQQASLTLPLWIGDIGQPAPPLCGCIAHEADYVCKQGDKVAAKVQNNEEENWILAEVVSYNSASCEYVVDDIDADEGQERHTLERNRVVPLPLWRANPLTDKEAIFQKDATVLALYPQTTCFYRGIVSEPPHTPQEEYLILFEDSSYIEGYSPPLNVAQLYVVASKDAN
jgi:SAGA-associated factor 29